VSGATTPRAAHAEVDRIDVGDEGISITGTLVGIDAPHASAELVARRRSDGAEARAPIDLDGDGFEAHVPFASLPWIDPQEPDFWDLYVAPEGGPELRVGRHLDDVRNKRHAYVFELRELELPAGGRRFRPFYDAANDVFIRTGPRGPGPSALPQAARSQPARRSVVPPHAMALHRLATALARAILSRRGAAWPRARSAERSKVTILIANAYGMGGTVRTVLNLAGFLAEHHDVEILSIQRLRAKPFFPLPPGVKVRVIDDQRKDHQLGGAAGRVRALLRRFPSRLIFPADLRFRNACSLWTDLMLLRALWRVREGVVMGTRNALNLAALLVKRPGVTVVGQEHMNLETHTPQRQREIARRYPGLDAITVLTERDRQTYAQMLRSAKRLERIPNAAPALDAPPASLERPIAIAAGRLTLQKEFDMLIPAFAKVVERHPEWTLRIYGDGPQRKPLERLIMEHGLSNNVLLMGPVRRLDLEMSQASLYVLSSRYEGLPMVMIEAMSLGLPVVSFDCPTGPAEVIEDGRSGILVPDGDVDALARSILAVIEDPERRRALGAGAAQRAKDYTLESIGARWEQLLAELSAA
jgi:glycosyltransferase involved in cell wall biosynthesis